MRGKLGDRLREVRGDNLGLTWWHWRWVTIHRCKISVGGSGIDVTIDEVVVTVTRQVASQLTHSLR